MHDVPVIPKPKAKTEKTYLRLLKQDPESPSGIAARKALDELYTQRQDWDRLIKLLIEQAEQGSDEDAVPLLRRISHLIEKELHDSTEALDVMLAADRLSKRNDEQIYKEVDRLAERCDGWAYVIGHYTTYLVEVYQTTLKAQKQTVMLNWQELPSLEHASTARTLELFLLFAPDEAYQLALRLVTRLAGWLSERGRIEESVAHYKYSLLLQKRFSLSLVA